MQIKKKEKEKAIIRPENTKRHLKYTKLQLLSGVQLLQILSPTDTWHLNH